VFAQQENFEDDMPFFRQKAALYQRWLDTTGLGQALRLETVRFAKHPITQEVNTSELELYLLLRKSKPNEALALWDSTRMAFERLTERPLTAELFQTFAHFMEIPPAQGNVQIHVEDKDGQKIPGFHIWAWSDDGVLKDSILAGTRAFDFEIDMPTIQVRKVARGQSDAVSKNKTAPEVFDLIMGFAYGEFKPQKYVGTDCAGRFPFITEEVRTYNRLEFSVSDLCREALDNSELSLWCKLAKSCGWDKDCNDIKRERLTFIFDYIPYEKSGYRLKCRLIGKFGSGIYKPRVSGYMEMDPDFLSFEQQYALKFKTKLLRKL